jgi:hypothetical protein
VESDDESDGERGGGSVLQGSPIGDDQHPNTVASLSGGGGSAIPLVQHETIRCHLPAILASDRCAIMLAQGGKVGGKQNMSSGINGIADDFEKRPLQSLATAPVVDMVALETEC